MRIASRRTLQPQLCLGALSVVAWTSTFGTSATLLAARKGSAFAQVADIETRAAFDVGVQGLARPARSTAWSAGPVRRERYPRAIVTAVVRVNRPAGSNGRTSDDDRSD